MSIPLQTCPTKLGYQRCDSQQNVLAFKTFLQAVFQKICSQESELINNDCNKVNAACSKRANSSLANR